MDLLLQKLLTRQVVFSVGCIAALLVATNSFAQSGSPKGAESEQDKKASRTESTLRLKTEKIIVFKDGYSLVLKTGSAVTDSRGEIHTHEVPDSAVLGSFWAIPKQGRMINMVAGWTEARRTLEKEVPCGQVIEILKANEGKSCRVLVKDQTFSGVIRKVLVQESQTALSPSLRSLFDLPAAEGRLPASHLSSRATASQLASALPAAATPNNPQTEHTERVTSIAGNYFVLATEQGDMLLSASQISQLTVKGMNTTLARKVVMTEKAKQLTFRFEKPGVRRELMIMYFRPGMRWIPSYRVNLTTNQKKEKVARVALQAEIINEAEDLIEVPVDIVVGVPNFRFRTIVSPFSLERTLRNTLVQAAPQLMGQFRNDMSNALYAQRSGEIRRQEANRSGVQNGGQVQLPGELTAAGKQDLFVYSLPKLRLRKGERTAVPIFETEAPYRDLYTWDFHMQRNDIATAPSGSGIESPLTLSKNEIWRQIELTNTTNIPWTTGAAMIMQGNQPLAQELLTYTSPGDICRVPVTVAVDVRGSYDEQEIKRELSALRWSGSIYAKITQSAKLDVCNNKNEPVDLRITFRFGGKAVRASHDGRITLAPYSSGDWVRYRGHPGVNNSSQITWKATLKPGETFLPTVDYYFYTRQ